MDLGPSAPALTPEGARAFWSIEEGLRANLPDVGDVLRTVVVPQVSPDHFVDLFPKLERHVHGSVEGLLNAAELVFQSAKVGNRFGVHQ